jgi:hypothetical protein
MLQGDRPATPGGAEYRAQDQGTAGVQARETPYESGTHWGNAWRGPMNVCASAQCVSGSGRTWMCTARGLELSFPKIISARSSGAIRIRLVW